MMHEKPSKQLKGMALSKKKVIINPADVIPESVKRTKTKATSQEPPKKIGKVAAFMEDTIDIVASALENANKSVSGYQVLNLVSIYKAMSETNLTLPQLKSIKYKAFMEEIENCLRTFNATGILPPRKLSIIEVIR
jgi:hypothetical protein